MEEGGNVVFAPILMKKDGKNVSIVKEINKLELNKIKEENKEILCNKVKIQVIFRVL